MESSISPTSDKNRSRRIISRVALALACLVGIVYAFEFTVEWQRKRLSQELISDIEQLRVGQTTENEIRRLSQKYEGKFSVAKNQNDSSQPPTYEISIWSPRIIIGNTNHPFPGRRLWGVLANLPIEDGYLSTAHFGLAVFRADGLALNPQVALTGIKPLAAPDGVSYFVYEPVVSGPLTESLGLELNSEATADERKKSFDFNLSWLTGLRECRHVCEIMPKVWKDLPLERRLRYGDGREKMIDSECQDRIS